MGDDQVTTTKDGAEAPAINPASTATGEDGAGASSRLHSIAEEARAVLQRPAIGASVAGGVVLAAGAFVGVTEALVAGVVALAVFRSLKKKTAAKAKAESAKAPATHAA